MKAKKSLGQHFLTSEAAVHHMVKASGSTKGDTVIEIGPGKGVLTKAILNTGANVIAVEKDDRMISVLSDTFSNEISNGRLKIVNGDILEADIHNLTNGESYSVIANIPYYITGEIMRLFLEHKHKPKNMTLLIQKEVAERIIARDKKESILSLSVKIFGQPKYISTVKRGSFHPIPNVDSAIIHIGNISDKNIVGFRIEQFFKIIKAGFAHKRKVLISNLNDLYTKDTLSRAFAELNLDLNTRAEDIPMTKWVDLTKLLN